jgi:hypothetical protein
LSANDRNAHNLFASGPTQQLPSFDSVKHPGTAAEWILTDLDPTSRFSAACFSYIRIRPLSEADQQDRTNASFFEIRPHYPY